MAKYCQMVKMTYILHSVKATLTSRLKSDLESSVSQFVRNPVVDATCRMIPRRLPRRSVRVTRNTSPFGRGYKKRAYVFHDYSYEFNYLSPRDPVLCLSRILGSLSTDTRCVASFSWYAPYGNSQAEDGRIRATLQQGLDSLSRIG